MMTVALTPELRQALDQAGGQPVRIEDPENHRAYVLLEEEAYHRLIPAGDIVIEPQSRKPEAMQIDPPLFDIPEGVRRSQKAFLRDLPELLKDEALRGKWVAYHGDERIGIAPSDKPLIQECLRRGLKSDQYDLFIIDETEEVSLPSSWLS